MSLPTIRKNHATAGTPKCGTWCSGEGCGEGFARATAHGSRRFPISPIGDSLLYGTVERYCYPSETRTLQAHKLELAIAWLNRIATADPLAIRDLSQVRKMAKDATEFVRAYQLPMDTDDRVDR